MGAATPWIRGPCAVSYGKLVGRIPSGELAALPTAFAAWPKGNMGAARGLHPRDVTYHDGVGLAAGRLVFGTISGPVLDSPPVYVVFLGFGFGSMEPLRC